MKKRSLNRKALRALSALLLLFLLLALPAMAEGEESGEEDEFSYVGELDPETGDVPGRASSFSEAGRAEISPGMGYDAAREQFVFPLTDGTELFSSAADGMIVTGRVILDYTGPSALTVYRNGEAVNLAGAGELRDPGVYAVAVGSETAARVCSFTILGPSTNLIHAYTVPEGFLLRGAERDGEEIEYSRYTVEMEQEGKYVVRYRCPLIDKDYTLSVVIDRTPPNLILSGTVGRDGGVHSAVQVLGLEPGDALYVTRDGEPVRLNTADDVVLTDTGVYTVTAADAAGNTVKYDFTIMLYLNTNAVMFILLFAAVVASVFIYAFWKRKSLKVR
ncbi:MAG: hypothetical protein IKP17_01640 [Oscillospiraceae bacterium]|nr:hypothetical protein [Oscillospiraceae bacterium]